MKDIELIEKRELVELFRTLGVRNDWHEPDEQGVSAQVVGTTFDNAGCRGEIMVTIYKDESPVATVNLATLFSWACGSSW